MAKKIKRSTFLCQVPSCKAHGHGHYYDSAIGKAHLKSSNRIEKIKQQKERLKDIKEKQRALKLKENQEQFEKRTLQFLLNKENKQSKELDSFRNRLEELQSRKKVLDEFASEAEDKTRHQKEIYTVEQEIKGIEKKEETLYYENKETDSNIRALKKQIKKEKERVVSRADEIDVWIDKGNKDAFLSQLLEQDVKLDDIDVITKRDEDSRYAVMIRAFSKYEVPKGDKWQVKNVFRGEGKLELNPKEEIDKLRAKFE